jgi:hypothetical protein
VTVYVDDAFIPYGRMKMCHMIADTTEELLRMADRINVDRRHIQKQGTANEHFDVSKARRERAVYLGAKEISTRELVDRIRAKRQRMSVTLKVGGEEFRCPCGCNVFTALGRSRYICNACGEHYQGGRDEKTGATGGHAGAGGVLRDRPDERGVFPYNGGSEAGVRDRPGGPDEPDRRRAPGGARSDQLGFFHQPAGGREGEEREP